MTERACRDTVRAVKAPNPSLKFPAKSNAFAQLAAINGRPLAFLWRNALRIAPALMWLAIGAGESRAATLYWDTNDVTAGSGAATGTWGSSAFWTTDSTGASATAATATSNADDLFFSAGTNGTTGTVTISGSQLAHAITFDDAVAITLNSGTAIDLGSATAGSGIFATAAASNTVNTPIVLDSAAAAVSISNTSSGTLTIGAVTGNAASGTQTITLALTSGTGRVTVSGNISDGAAGGNVAVTRSAGAGITTLSGTNTYTGATTITGGVLLFGKRAALYNADSSKWTPANVTVNSGGTIGFSVGGTNEFTTSDVTTLLGNLSAVSNNGLKAGSSIGFSTSNATGGSFTVADSITNSTGTGGGAIGVTKLGTGTLVLSGVNTYTGITRVTGGTVNVQNDQSAANGGWTISDDSFPSGSTTVNFEASSTVAVASGKTISISTGTSSTVNPTLNVAGTVVDSGSLTVGRQGSLKINNGGSWIQNGAMSVSTTSATSYSASLSVNAGATFTYSGASAITLNPSSNGGGGSSLTIAGGTFVTAKGFSDTVASSSGAANLNLSSGGTLKLAADIPTLTASSGSAFNFTLGNGGGVIDTNGFSTTMSRVIGGTGALTKAGAGTLTLGGANTYTGNTNVNAGTLLVSGSLAGSLIAVNGGTFAGAGSVSTGNQSFTLASGAKLDPGTNGTTGLSVDTGSAIFDISAGVVDANTGALLFNLDAPTNSDKVTLTLGTLEIGSGGLDFADFSFTTSAGFGAGTYTLFDNAAISGTLASSGLSGTIGGLNATIGISNGDIILMVVPEPTAAMALIGGAGLLIGLRPRRSRRRVF